MNRKLRRAFFLTVMALLAVGLATTLRADTQSKCEGLANLKIPGTEITLAEFDPAGDLPELCHIRGNINPAVGFELVLPTGWNGELYFQGNLGFAGDLQDTSGLIAGGYASASTDAGHQSDDIFDASWALDNRPAEIDYGYRAVHVTTVVAKTVIGAYYGQGPSHSIFNGCSDGGREGLMEAQRYPTDFEGIVVFSPALDLTGGSIAANWDMQALHATPISTVLTLDKLPVINAAVLANCDVVDGIVDGLIDDPRKCTFDPASLQCPSGDGPDCLTAIQVNALKKIYAGPSNSHGEQLYPGLSVGGETLNHFEWDAFLINTSDGPSLSYKLQDQFFRYLAFQKDDPNFDWRTFDFDKDPARLRFMGKILNATDPDLSAFREHGGKVLIFQGWSDPVVAPVRTIEYLKSVWDEAGRKKTDQFARLFMMPGGSHCFGGTGPNDFDFFTPLENWIQKGMAPDSIVATQWDDNGNFVRTRPLCPYPKVEHYKGQGSTDDAASFECRDPE